jgi:hypothetical protein
MKELGSQKNGSLITQKVLAFYPLKFLKNILTFPKTRIFVPRPTYGKTHFIKNHHQTIKVRQSQPIKRFLSKILKNKVCCYKIRWNMSVIRVNIQQSINTILPAIWKRIGTLETQ